MKIENGHIVEATTRELRNVWFNHDWCEIMTFNEYLIRLKRRGVKIIDYQGEDSEHY